MSRRTRALALTVVATVAGAVALGATPASASISQGFVSGAGAVDNDRRA